MIVCRPGLPGCASGVRVAVDSIPVPRLPTKPGYAVRSFGTSEIHHSNVSAPKTDTFLIAPPIYSYPRFQTVQDFRSEILGPSR
jgi:hypothetical protein